MQKCNVFEMDNKNTACGTNTLVCQCHNSTKILVKKGHNSKKYSFQSYAPCLATASRHDEQAFQVWC